MRRPCKAGVTGGFSHIGCRTIIDIKLRFSALTIYGHSLNAS